MELLDSRQLRAFQLLARTGSFTAAARQMFLTQSAVSHSIKALETSLGVKLLDRGGGRVALTVEGESLLAHTETILTEMKSATADLQALSQWGYGRLRIGATDSMCQYLLPPALLEFRESYANCDVKIRAADTEATLDDLLRGEIDLAIGIDSESTTSGLNFQPLFEDRLIFAVPSFHPWATGELDPIETLSDQRYIIYARSSPTSRMVEANFRRMGLHSPRLTELRNMEAIRELAKIGMGVGVIAPWVIQQDLDEGVLREITPPGEPMIRKWGVFSRKKSGLTMTAEVFTGICRRIARDLAPSEGPHRQEAEPTELPPSQP